MQDLHVRASSRHSAYYGEAIPAFLARSDEEVLGALASASGFADDPTQKQAWATSIALLREALVAVAGTLYLEFDVPRLGSRIDAVVVSGSAIVPIEFKCGESAFRPAHRYQAWDYGLDLRNFHAASHAAPIFPILVATAAGNGDVSWSAPHADGVYPPRSCNGAALRVAITSAVALATGPPLDGQAWGRAPYQPTPTIIEAARALYARHTVEDITRSDAGATNLGVTSRTVEDIIERARSQEHKAIVFVTGVPGAGKTLVGLDIATARSDRMAPGHAVFLSGNGPLVAVLREALTRDELARCRASGTPRRKGEIAQPIKQFIQNVHHFRDAGLRDAAPPHDRVVIFDEAQRAWNRDKTALFMRQRKGQPDFDQSEAEFLVRCMDRHDGWAAVVCLVGGGQEIHTGEAGIAAWLDAVRTHFPAWHVYVSSDLTDSEYAAGHAVEALRGHEHVTTAAGLHLATSLRSFRAEKLSAFVKAVLDCDRDAARALLAGLGDRYPIAMTRDLGAARRWIRAKARGSERFGLVASSQALRLKPHAIDVRVSVDPVQWFLNERQDTRSSWYLEDAATEFQVQGLELDWVCVTWDADLRFQRDAWRHHAFRGDRWTNINKPDRRQYLLNAYRVLLTRARQGMVLFVPPGDPEDPTRQPAFYDDTYAYLAGLGVEPLP